MYAEKQPSLHCTSSCLHSWQPPQDQKLVSEHDMRKTRLTKYSSSGTSVAAPNSDSCTGENKSMGNSLGNNDCGSGVEPESWSEGRCFDSPGLHVEASLGKILNPKLLLMCWSAPCMAATAISVWMYVWITVSSFGQRHLLSVLNVNV